MRQPMFVITLSNFGSWPGLAVLRADGEAATASVRGQETRAESSAGRRVEKAFQLGPDVGPAGLEHDLRDTLADGFVQPAPDLIATAADRCIPKYRVAACIPGRLIRFTELNAVPSVNGKVPPRVGRAVYDV